MSPHYDWRNERYTIDFFDDEKGKNYLDFCEWMESQIPFNNKRMTILVPDIDFDWLEFKKEFCDSLQSISNKVKEAEFIYKPANQDESYSNSYRLMDVLFTEGLLPNYSFPRNIVNFWIEDLNGIVRESPERSIDIALSEYAPGRSLVVNKQTYISGGLYDYYTKFQKENRFKAAQPWLELDETSKKVQCCSNGACGWFGVDEQFESCPLCGSELITQTMIKPWGFAAREGRNVPETQENQEMSYASEPSYSSLPSGNEMEQVGRAGFMKIENRENQNLVIINKGPDDEGFELCSECGAIEPATINSTERLNRKRPYRIKMLKLRWKDLQFDELVKELICISSYISTIGEAAFNICDISDTIIEKINFSDNNIALTQIKNLMELSIVNKNVDNKAFYTKEILKKAKKPESYIDMLQLYQAVGINSHEFALRFDDEITSIYNKKIVSELIVAIMERKYQKIPEFFEYDVFFNDFSQCIDAIGNLLSGVNLYQRIERDKLEENIGKCVDSAALKSYIEQMESKRIFLANQHLDLNNIMSEYNQSMTENFAENINIIKQNIDDQAAFLTLSSEEKKLRTVFVLDTCAIIHHPDLLNYFSMDEYIRIPTKVIDELGKIKDGRSNKYDYETSNIARNVSKDIENALITMNKQTAYRFVIENANTDLLPLDLDPMVPDNQILSVAMKYMEEKPIIISDDGVFRLTSTSQNIETISGADFIQSRKNGTRSMPRVEVTEQKKDNVDVSIDTPPDVTETTWKKLPLSSLRKIAPVMDNNVITYLSQNKIRTIGDFFELTLEAVDRLPGRAKQAIYKNAINSVINKKDEIMTKIQSGALN